MNNDQEKEFNKKLTAEEYRVLREKGTEPAFSGQFVKNTDPGVYKCKACGNKLFSSKEKFETKIPGLVGWPSFEDAIPGNVEFVPDDSLGMHRTEVVCAKCKSHLGHLFDDKSETKTGQHYCINSVCLELEKE